MNSAYTYSLHGDHVRAFFTHADGTPDSAVYARIDCGDTGRHTMHATDARLAMVDEVAERELIARLHDGDDGHSNHRESATNLSAPCERCRTSQLVLPAEHGVRIQCWDPKCGVYLLTRLHLDGTVTLAEDAGDAQMAGAA